MYKLLEIPLPQDASDHSIIWWGVGLFIIACLGTMLYMAGNINGQHNQMYTTYLLEKEHKVEVKKQHETMWQDYQIRMALLKKENEEFEGLKKDVKEINEKYGRLESDFRHIKSELETLNKHLPSMQSKLFEMLEGTEKLIGKISSAQSK